MSYTLKFAAIPVARTGPMHIITALFTPVLDDTTGNTLEAFGDWVNWPTTLENFAFEAVIGEPSIRLPASPLEIADRDIWTLIFDKSLPVATPANRSARDRRAQSYESFEGTAVADDFTRIYELAAVEGADILGHLARSAGPDRALLPLEQPLTNLSRLHRSAREWCVWLPDNASEQEKAATEVIAACAEPLINADSAFLSDLTLVSRQADDETYGEPSVSQKLRRLNAMVLRGLLEKHNLWPAVRNCSGIGASPLRLRTEFVDSTASEARRIADAAVFHRLPPPRSGDRLIPNRMDFHDYLAALTQHPPLLGKLGLAFRLQFSWSDISTMRGRFRIVAKRRTGEQFESAWTMFERTTSSFAPSGWEEGDRGMRPARRIRHGFLDLSQGYDLRCVDNHEAYLKFKAVGSPVGTGHEAQTVSGPGQDNPKLQTAGILLLEGSPATKLQATVARSESLLNALDDELPLYAEDLLSGFRVDARKIGDAQWHSLCLRETYYDFIGSDLRVRHMYRPDPQDRRTEGAVSQAVSHTNDGGLPQVQEEVFRWQNWSLAAPLPTKKLPPPDYDPIRMPPPIFARHRAMSETLPWLEFGHTYQVRCRAMFLDGSGFSKDDGNEPAAQRQAKFERQEWVGSPNVLLAWPLEETRNCGETLTLLAIRSTNGRASRQSAERYTVPPKVDASLPLYHGYTIHRGIGAFRDRAFRADGAFISAHELKHGPNQTNPAEIPTMDRNPVWSARRGGRPVFDRYYPDPLAYEFHIWLEWSRTIDGRPEVVETEYKLYDSPKDWPRSRALRVVLVGATPEQKRDGELRILRRGQSYAGVRARDEAVLVVLLRMGISARLLIGTLPFMKSESEPIGTEAIEANSVRWVDRLRNNGVFGTLSLSEQRLVLAAHPFANSPLELRLVHAVDKPRLRPRFVSFEPMAVEGSAPIDLNFTVSFDVPTTARLDLTSEWSDWLDDSAIQIGISGGEVVGTGNPGLRAAKTTAHIPPPLDIPPPSGAWEHQEERSFKVTHLLPDTKYREIIYSLQATTRYREFFEPAGQPATTDSSRYTTPGANQWRVKVLNRAIPREVEFLYSIPAFDWERSRRNGIYLAFRRGGVVRLYLKRPWNDSGNDEMLGVILADGPNPSPVTSILHRISRWGQDPVRDSLPVNPVLALGSFMGYSTHLNNVPLLKESGQRLVNQGDPGRADVEREPVTVVGYIPKFPDQRTCYVDLEIDPGKSYYPFVSLSIARFQQHSLPGMHLSATTRLDPVQLAPHRWVHAWKERSEQLIVRMFGYTHSRTALPQSQLGTRLRVSLQERLPGTDRELCWVSSLDRQGAEIRVEVFPRPYSSLRFRPELSADFLPTDDLSYWEARLPVPDGSFAMKYRLVLEEVEEFLQEVHVDNDGNSPKPWELTSTKPAQRVVFTEIVEL